MTKFSIKTPRNTIDFTELLRWRATHQPNEIAYEFLLDGDEIMVSLTYGELDRQARAIGTLLQNIGAVGERVLLLFPPGLDYIAAYFGCLYAGSVAVPAYPPSSSRLIPRLQVIAEDAGALVSLTTSKLLDKMAKSYEKYPELNNLTWKATDNLPNGLENGWQEPAITSDTLAFLQYTSGSTSKPKGVMVSHGNLMHNSRMIQEAFEQGPDDRGVIWLPPYHDMGLIGGILQPLYSGFPVTLMSPYDFMQQPLNWLKAISRTEATISGGPNFAFDLCIKKITEEQKQSLDLSKWKVAFTGAEPIRAETLKRFAAEFACCGFKEEAFFPCYGLAEGTLIVSGGNVNTMPLTLNFDVQNLEEGKVLEVQEVSYKDGSRTLIGCGETLLDQKICIVDPVTLKECSEGMVGEIWVMGDSVAKGYWNMFDENDETFSAYLQDTCEGPFLRTGDMGFRHYGEFFVTGRIKDLIIIRGRNLYPQDIELTLESSHPAARPNSGAAFSVTIQDEEQLVVVQEVERTYRNLDPEEMIDAITQRIIVEYGVQPYAVILLKLGGVPRTSSGKIQRNATRELFLNGELNEIVSRVRDERAEKSQQSAQIVLSSQELQALSLDQRTIEVKRVLIDLLTQASGVSISSSDIHASVSEVGVDSLKAFEIQHFLEEKWGVLISAVSFLQGMTLAEMCDRILIELEEPESSTLAREERGEGHVAASRGQKGLYFLQNLAPESTAYHIARAVRITGPLDVVKTERIFNKMVARHESLRTTFVQDQVGELQYRISDEAHFEYSFEMVESWSEEQLEARLQEETHRQFNLESGPLMRAILMRRSEEEHLLLWVFHHIIVDLWSIDVLLSEFISLLKVEGDIHNVLAKPKLQFSDFTQWQEYWLSGSKGEQHLCYWSNKLAGELPILDLPTDRPRTALQTYKGSSSAITLNIEQLNQLKELARKHGATLYMTLLTGYAILLNRYTGQDDLIIGSPMAGRTRAEMNKLVGYITNTVPLRFTFGKEERTCELLSQVRQHVLESFEHQEYPFDLLVEKINPKRDTSRSPVYQTVFVMQNVSTREVGAMATGQTRAISTWGNLQVEAIPLPETSALFDLTLTVAETDNGLVATMQYNTDLFEADTADRMLQHFVQLLDSMVEDDQQMVNLLNMLKDEEKRQLAPLQVAGTTTKQNLVELFEEQVLSTPSAVAAIYEDRHMTYEELDNRSNQLSRYLRARDMQVGEKIGLYVDRSLEMMIGILGILKAGGAYLPLDPAYPQERLQFVIEDAGISFLLTQSHLLEGLTNPQGAVICLDREWDEITQEDKSALSLSISPDSLAYVIYTSGSTGKPKGVLVSHQNVVRLFQSTEHWFHFDQHDVWTLFHSYAFDFSVWEIWGALLKGGKLVIVPYWVSRNTEEFYSLLYREGVTVLNQTPSAFQQLIHVEESAKEKLPLALRYVIFGGEALRLQSLIPWMERHGDNEPQLINMYGITETTVHVTYRRITKQDLFHQNNVIGVPIPDLQVYVLDQYLQPMPTGVPGEMFVGGAGVAKGYLNRPDLTVERFIVNPFNFESEERLYRTGDLARRLPNGELEYLGRIDNQVKIRGYRIELGEIELELTQMEEVREAVVLKREDNTGEKVLIAYVVPRNMKKGLNSVVLKTILKTKIPEFMVPAHFVFLNEFTLTPNGKVDSQALPGPPVGEGPSSRDFISPSSKIGKQLASIWEKVLGVANISITDNFFDIGGDSIRTIRVLTLAKEQGLVLTLQDLYLHQTIKELEQLLKTTEIKEEVQYSITPFELVSSEDRALISREILDAYPLTSLQAGLVFHSEYSPDYKNYISTFRLSVRFHEQLLLRAIQRLTDRHPMLRTSFEVRKYSVPLQILHEQVTPRFSVVDWRDMGREEQEEHFVEFLDAQKYEKFVWREAPLLRFSVQRLTDETIQFTMTEPFLDGWSVASLITELFGDYLALMEEPTLQATPMLESTFRDYVAAEKSALQDEASQKFWERELGDCIPTHLPRWDRKQTESHLKKDRVWVQVPEEVSNGLRLMAKNTLIPLKSILLAAHLRVVSMLSGQSDVLTGMFENGRLEQHQGEKVLGLFLNTVPVRVKLQRGGTWKDLAQKSFEIERDLLPHRRFPLAELQRLYGGRQQLFETAFNYTHFHVYEGLTELEGLEVLDAEHTDNTFINLTAQFMVDVNSDLIRLCLDYNPQELDIEQMDNITHYYLNVLSSVVADPSRQYHEIPLLAKRELQKILLEVNDTSTGEEEVECIHHLFELQAAQFPDRIALKNGERFLTYGEVNSQANRLARRLQRFGAGPDKLVGIYLDRSLEMVVGLLGILKTGAAYVPLDPTYPKERLEFMITDANLVALLTEESLIDELPALQVPLMCLDIEWELMRHECELNLDLNLSPEQLAYVIYTSGSTGRPKGVQVPHSGVVNFLRSMQQEPGLGAEDILVAVTSISFDIAALELYLPLITGAVLVVAGKEVVNDSERLIELLEREHATILQATPATWNMLMHAGWKNSSGLKMLCGGEPLQRDLIKKLLELGDVVWNLYGPTETTIWSTLHPITSADEPTLIGRPIRNTEVYVLDSFGHPVPFGVEGELCIGGAGVTLGYLNRPELTEEKFVLHPFSDRKEARIYRTGDLARFLPDGCLECLGRLDDQVKIRGFRIELGEIETRLSEHEAIKQAVVVARPAASGEIRLVAYFIPETKDEVEPAVLRSHMKERVPDYMVPTLYVSMEKFPLLPNGKLDRRALPAPELMALEIEDGWEEPQKEIEAKIAGIWGELLGYPRVGLHQEFYELGGHSLLAMQLISRLREAFGVELSLRNILEGSTVAKMSQEVECQLQQQEQDEDLDELLDQLESISEEEVMNLLLKKEDWNE